MDRVRRMFGGGGGTGARIFAGEDPYGAGGSGASAATLPHRASQLTSLQTKPHRGGGGAGRPSLIDSGKTYSSGVARFGLAKAAVYFSDPFHTLLSLPWWKFILVFFATYITQFCTFAFLYLSFPAGSCTTGIDGAFSHALWMSSRVASTLGFGTQIYPEADCVGVNLMVMLQVICSSLIDFIMLGIVFARFSAPFKRAGSIRFSSAVAVSRAPHAAGCWALTFRLANIRKHQLLKPEIKVLLTALDSITPSNYVFEYLEVEAMDVQQTNLQLGFPANLVHVVRPGSPLYALSLAEMDARMMEVLVFVDGVDAMTSKQMQARKAYAPADMHMAAAFVDLHLEMRGGKLGLDFTAFDDLVAAGGDVLAEYAPGAPHLAAAPLSEVSLHLGHLRHLTFKRLTEQAKTRDASGANAGGASSSGGAAAAAAAGVGGGVSGGIGRSGSGAIVATHQLPLSVGATGNNHSSSGMDGGGVELGAVAGGAAAAGVPRPASGSRDVSRNPFDQQASGGFSTLPL